MTIKNKRKNQYKWKYTGDFKVNISTEYIKFKREQEMKMWFGSLPLEIRQITTGELLTQIHNDRIR